MPLELDHIFVLTATGVPALDRLLNCGFIEGGSNVHPGQGTANRRLFFHNAKLEFLWVCHEAEVRSAAIAPTRLWERSRSQQTGFSPFGICLRWSDPDGMTSTSLPCATWDFRPPYLPPGLSIAVASQTKPTEPMLFATPFGKRPDRLSGDRVQPLNHANGCRDITRVRLTVPGGEPLSDAIATLRTVRGIEIVRDAEFAIEVECDRARQGKQFGGSSDLPLNLFW